tara:strand:+ start:1743 stop:1970 length:228 start_codon:yes stop_codon:yes gene_type:complete
MLNCYALKSDKIGGQSMPGPTELLILLVIFVLVFGTKKLRGMGGDLGSAIKSFKSALKDDDKQDESNKGNDESEK